jgi:uncharacterized protein (TIGR00730 family)
MVGAAQAEGGQGGEAGAASATTDDAMNNLCVFAGSSDGVRPEYLRAAGDLGHVLARRGVGLVYGGARVGLMGAVADAVLAGGGQVTGVIPRAMVQKEVAHDGLSDLRIVASMHERKALMADLSDGFIAIPGGWGTLDEFFEILTWAQLGLHQKPCGLLNVQGYFDRLLSFLEHATTEGFVRREYRALISVADSPAALLDLFKAHRAPQVEKWIDVAET